MFVYVVNADGKPLMPTERCGKVRRLLKENKAKVIKRCPFTIQLLYQAETNLQPITLGVDAGSKIIGLSATTESKELYASEIQLRNKIVELIATKRDFRRARRNRKTRYRAPRFNNRAKPEKWIAPSIQQKIETHINVVNKVCSILPISKIIVETASFDIQKIKNPDIQGKEYQQGEQFGFWNVREYVLWRDEHKCQCCKGKSKDPILTVHHIETPKTGGNAPNNLVTLCETCHTGFHQGKIELPKTIKRGMVFRDAAFMGIMRWAFYDKLQELYPDMVSMTWGYKTKKVRIDNKLPKSSCVDARCISGNPTAKPLGFIYFQKKIRCHNRQIHKATINKGGYRKLNQLPFLIKGFRLYDKVLANGKIGFIFGRRSSGSFDVRMIDGTKISTGISYKKLKLLEKRKYYLTERIQDVS